MSFDQGWLPPPSLAIRLMILFRGIELPFGDGRWTFRTFDIQPHTPDLDGLKFSDQPMPAGLS